MNNINDTQIKEILLKFNYVAPEELEKAEELSKRTHTSIIDYLLTNEYITSDLLGQALAEYYDVPYVNLNVNPPSKELVEKLPEDIARKYQAVLIKENENEITITTDNPKEQELIASLKELFSGKEINIAFSLTENIEQILLHYQKSLDARFIKIINDQQKVAPEIINEILEDALAYRASDIHFEPQEAEVIIRFRIDDVLQEAGRIPKIHYENILNRIKVQAHLRIDEHFSPQDGAIRYKNEGKTVDLRVSIVPTLVGEKIVIRLLAQYIRSFTLADIGLSENNQEIISRAAKKPFGMILVAGPTGSGKTTTLYSLLKSINKPEINITTIEDPVEYRLLGINQIQVNENITFAKGLRSIVRQDPNVILVGEIRDNETAEIAINTALTGHLLLSTFHANDAATAIPRLLDMEIEPFLLSSTLELIIAQRLIRKICPSCRISVNKTIDEIKHLSPHIAKYFSQNNTLYEGKGCTACSNTGFSGRTSIFEFIQTTKNMRDLILKQPSTKEVWDLAIAEGSYSLFEDGIRKVENGITTLEELLRVAVPPQNE